MRNPVRHEQEISCYTPTQQRETLSGRQFYESRYQLRFLDVTSLCHLQSTPRKVLEGNVWYGTKRREQHRVIC